MVLRRNHKFALGHRTDTFKIVYIDAETFYRHTFVAGKSGSGKSHWLTQFVPPVSQHQRTLVFDPNTHLAHEMLDRFIGTPLIKDCLYLSITDSDVVPLIDFLQQSIPHAHGNLELRISLAEMFTAALIVTAGAGGASAGAGFVRLKFNVELGVRLLLETKRPLALLPHLFKFRSNILPQILQECRDTAVKDHFTNLLSIRQEHQFYALVESTLTRLHQMFNSVVVESMMSVNGDGILVEKLLNQKRGCVICDFGVTGTRTQTHSRLIQKLLLDSIKRVCMKRSPELAAQYPVGLFIDEATSSGLLDLAELEALQVMRKFGVAYCFLVQGTAGMRNQQTDVSIIDGVFENTAAKLIFGLASDTDAIRFAKLGIGGMDFKEAKLVKENERQKLLGYETYSRTTVSTGPDGNKSFSVTPVERPILSTEIDSQEVLYTADELFYKDAGNLLGLPTGTFRYYGPGFPGGVLLCTIPPKFVPSAIQKRNKRRREEFIRQQLTKFPYRDIDGIQREFRELVNRYGLSSDSDMSEEKDIDVDFDPNNPFD